jgi:predicted tellurium resistance membrane protein TerC
MTALRSHSIWPRRIRYETPAVISSGELTLLGILIVDLTVAGDNALVIALAVRTLPRRQQIAARLWGSAGAVGLRVAFIAIVTFLLTIPLLQVVGGLLLLWIALRLVRQLPEAESHARETGSLWRAVWVIMVPLGSLSKNHEDTKRNGRSRGRSD